MYYFIKHGDIDRWGITTSLVMCIFHFIFISQKFKSWISSFFFIPFCHPMISNPSSNLHTLTFSTFQKLDSFILLSCNIKATSNYVSLIFNPSKCTSQTRASIYYFQKSPGVLSCDTCLISISMSNICIFYKIVKYYIVGTLLMTSTQ